MPEYRFTIAQLNLPSCLPGVRVLIMTGDNEHVTRKTAIEVGLPADNIIVGTQVDTMDNSALAY